MCGIFSLIGKLPIADSIYLGMNQLQHRGQDAAGIFTYDHKTHKHSIHKDLGLVNEVYATDPQSLPYATWGIGHVRYSTIGKGKKNDAQPLYIQDDHTIAMAHNGNLVNYASLRRDLEMSGTLIETTCDLEPMLHIFSSQLPKEEIIFPHIIKAAKHLFQKAHGAYSVVCLIAGVGVVAIRDPHGIRPLLMGSNYDGQSFGFASENNALNVFGFDTFESVKPGEVVFIDKDLVVYRETLSDRTPSLCSFEHNYFSKPNTIIDDIEVYESRCKLGEALAEHVRKANLPIDVVCAVPSSARASAIALAKALEIDYQEGFVKQDNVGRTFIMPTQGIRQKALSRKLGAVHSVFKGKNILLIDDSIVRGTVSKRVVSLARWAGANRVYFASTYPPIRHPCVYGIDFPTPTQLIAHNRTNDEIAQEIAADALFYNTEKDLENALGTPHLCTACLTGNYPTETHGFEEFQKLREEDLKAVQPLCKL